MNLSRRDYLAGQALAGIMARPVEKPDLRHVRVDLADEFLPAFEEGTAHRAAKEAFRAATHLNTLLNDNPESIPVV